MRKINGFDIDGYDGFAYDGCHKIYLYRGGDADEFRELGYSLYSLNAIVECYAGSCSLKFITAYDGGNYTHVVRQFCERVEFEGFDCVDGIDGIEVVDGMAVYECGEYMYE